MQYYSTNQSAPKVNFKEAVIKGLAPDKGLYFPENIQQIPDGMLGKGKDLVEICQAYVQQFVGDEISQTDLKQIIKETIDFPLPIVEVEPNIYSLELWHGPTCAFKDVGARFLARCLSYFVKQKGEKVTILVATSGDTGSAVANGFYGVPGIDVVILYPKGKVSKIQEQQLTTIGNNVRALEINGTFDDCQRMVKEAFNDEELNQKMNLSSANSINVARFLPQAFYYFAAYEQLKDKDKDVVFAVPSGNFGNITAGMFAKKTGLPISKFIAGTNANDIVPQYLKSGIYKAKPSVSTISNAMDIGDPSNFPRIVELNGGTFEGVKAELVGYAFTDDETKTVMKEVVDRTGYVLEPHGAIAYLALKEYMKDHDCQGILLETAHPAKFHDVVEPVIGQKVEIPQRLQDYLSRKKEALLLNPEFKALKEYLLGR